MPAPDGPVIVSGAAGYLGGRLLTSLGGNSRGLVRAPVSWLPERMQSTCDLLGPRSDVTDAMRGASAVVHLAGHNEVIARREPERAVDETAAMAEAVLSAARDAGVPRIVYVSTVHVYGEHLRPGAVIDETLEPAPTSPYARARLACEQIFHRDDAVDAVVLRLTNAVGAPVDPAVDRWTLVANDLCRQAVLERRMVLHSSGQQWRDFVVLDDACRLVVGALDHTAVPAGTYNLGSGRSATIRSLAQLVQERVERSCGWRATLEAPPITGDPDEPYSVDVSRLGSRGLRAQLPLEEGVDEIVEHCIKHESWLRQQGQA